jgi:hypothetical protein
MQSLRVPIAAGTGRERSVLTASTSHDEFAEPAIATFYLGSSGAALWFVVRMNVGTPWLPADWEKVSS